MRQLSSSDITFNELREEMRFQTTIDCVVRICSTNNDKPLRQRKLQNLQEAIASRSKNGAEKSSFDGNIKWDLRRCSSGTILDLRSMSLKSDSGLITHKTEYGT